MVDERERLNNRVSLGLLESEQARHYKFEGSKIELESHDPDGDDYRCLHDIGH